MSEKDDGGPAFPETRWDDKTGQEVQWLGMSLRDYFAAKAMTGLMTMVSGGCHDITSNAQLAQQCYAVADAAIKARAE